MGRIHIETQYVFHKSDLPISLKTSLLQEKESSNQIQSFLSAGLMKEIVLILPFLV